MKGYRDRRQLTPRKKYVKNKFVTVFAGFKTPTAVSTASTSMESDKQENRADDEISFEKGND